MKRRIRVLSANSSAKIEKMVNAWIDSNEVNIIDIDIQTVSMTWRHIEPELKYTATIQYYKV